MRGGTGGHVEPVKSAVRDADGAIGPGRPVALRRSIARGICLAKSCSRQRW